MKATLVFNLSDPDDREQYKMAVDGHKYRYAFDEVFNFLRSEGKSDLSKSDYKYLDKIRSKIVAIYNEETEL